MLCSCCCCLPAASACRRVPCSCCSDAAELRVKASQAMVECKWAQKVTLSMSCLLGAVVLDGCHWFRSVSKEARSWSAPAVAGILAVSSSRSCAVYRASVKGLIAGAPPFPDLHTQVSAMSLASGSALHAERNNQNKVLYCLTPNTCQLQRYLQTRISGMHVTHNAMEISATWSNQHVTVQY